MCNMLIQWGRRKSSWIALSEVILTARNGKALPESSIQKTMLSSQGEAQAIVSRCFDGDTSTDCFNKSMAVSVANLKAGFPCSDSGVRELHNVKIFNTE